jgi:FKBP-type peptidyl-prolyl cis-trans isomerase
VRRSFVLAALALAAACGRPLAPPRALAGGGTVVELDPGDGAVAEDGSWIEVQYDARAAVASASGAAAVDPFDSTCNAEPFTFRLGRSRVLPGFAEGLLGMREGARRRITLPPDAAYGAIGKGPVPAGATLEYDVALERVFHKTTSGLQWLERKSGSGPSPRTGERVAIRVTGWLVETGRSLLDRRHAGERYELVLGAGDAVPALEEALPMMRKGALWRLGVAPELGFGSGGHLPLLLPGQDLVLDVELLEIHETR